MGRKFKKKVSTWRGIKRRIKKEKWILRIKKRGLKLRSSYLR